MIKILVTMFIAAAGGSLIIIILILFIYVIPKCLEMSDVWKI